MNLIALLESLHAELQMNPWTDEIRGKYLPKIYTAIAELREQQAPTKPEQPCIGNDPACPCQDGLACHYKDAPDGTKGWPIPAAPTKPEQPKMKCECGHWDCRDAQTPAAIAKEGKDGTANRNL